MKLYKGQVRLVKQPYVQNRRIEDDKGVRYIYAHQPDPKLQQFDGEKWDEVPIIEEGEQ